MLTTKNDSKARFEPDKLTVDTALYRLIEGKASHRVDSQRCWVSCATEKVRKFASEDSPEHIFR